MSFSNLPRTSYLAQMHDTIPDSTMTSTTGSCVSIQPMVTLSDKKPCKNARNSFAEIAAAVERLSKVEPSQDLHFWQGRSSPDIATKIRAFTEMVRGFRQPFPLSQSEKDNLVFLHFEEDLWKDYGLNGVLVPDELLKESQKRLYEAENGSVTTTEVMCLRTILEFLDEVHHKRKSEPFSGKGYSMGKWMPPESVDPTDEMKSKGHSFWALIIGNDKYSEGPLSGCVNDALLVNSYIKDYLGVPDHHITLLMNATRQEMINGFYNLRDNTSIQRGDNILIHFSGHGTSYDASKYFTAFTSKAGSIEGICPIDRGPSVPDISDRELNSILHELQVEKGNKITLFFDCCHSGGATRSLDSSIRYTLPLPRTHHTPSSLSAMLEAADRNPRRRPNTRLISDESWMGDVSGFVQLASCQDYQKAGEVNFPLGPNSNHIEPNYTTRRSELADDGPRGLLGSNVKGKPRPPPVSAAPSIPQRSRRYGCFTWALINVLRSEIGRTGTYESVIASIGQFNDIQPVVVGRRKGSRLWFNGEI